MIRLLLPPVLLGLGTGCLSLDFMFTSHIKSDGYTLEDERVPPEHIEIVSFDRGDGVQLYGVWLRQDPGNPSPPVIYFHGNGNNLETSFERIAYYYSWGRYDVFAVDYAGFGMSEGEATYDNLAEIDGHATVAYVSDTTGVPPEEIPWLALSLGGFVALHTNDDVPARAIVIESVFASSDLLLDTSLVMDVAPGWFFADDWNNVSAIAEVTAPVYVIHGLADDFIDPRSGPLLHEAANDPTELWQPEGVNHSDLHLVEPEAFEERAVAWFDRFAE